MFTRINKLLEQNKVISDCQFGFREGRSTSSAILKLNEHVLKSFERKEVIVAMFLDYIKAFETMNHKILIHKLEHFGIRGNVLS